MVHSLDYSNSKNIPESWIKQRNSLHGLAQLKFDLKYFFINAAIGQVKDYANVLREFPADVLLADSFFLGASLVHEHSGLPWAQLGVSVLTTRSRDTALFGLKMQPSTSALGHLRNIGLNWLFQNVLFRDLLTYTNEVRASIGLPTSSTSFFDSVSPFLYLAGTVPEFEYPRSDLPLQVHFVGPLLSDPPSEFTPPFWWSDLQRDQPIVHVTQGTVATDPEQLIVPTLRALEQENVLVIATTGGQPIDTVKLHPIPKNARVELFIRHYYLLPHVDVMVTNGGYNGVQLALANGVPMLAAGQTEDKPEVCARIEWSGVGIHLKPKKPTPKQIKEAVQKLLSEPNYKTRAKYLQTQVSHYHAPTRSVELLESLARTKQPILRLSV
jgi:MGT family glycosyltransferase